MSFAQPGTGGDTFDLKNNGQAWKGSLMLVWPKELKPNFDSGKFEPTDVVVCDIALIDRDDPATGNPLFFKDAFLFSKGLVANTRGAVGDPDPVLGRLVQRQFAQGVGWSLDEFTPADAAAADKYLREHPRNVAQQPASAAPPFGGNDDPWAGVNAAAATPAVAAPVAPPAAAPAPTGNPWDSPAPAPAGWQAGAQGLVDYLKARGINPDQIPDQATAENIARGLPAS